MRGSNRLPTVAAASLVGSRGWTTNNDDRDVEDACRPVVATPTAGSAAHGPEP